VPRTLDYIYNPSFLVPMLCMGTSESVNRDSTHFNPFLPFFNN
jgi:hypothetical protein